MGGVMQMKLELKAELERQKQVTLEKKEDVQKAKEEEEIDDLARMIREAAKKSKK